MGPWLTLISTSEAILLCVYQPSILSVLLTFPSVARAQAAAVPTGRLLHAKGASHFKRKYRRPNHGARRGAGRRASPLRAHLRLASPPQQIIANYPPPLLQNCHEHWSEKARVLLRCTRVPRTASRFPRVCQPPASAVAIWVHPPPRFSSKIHGRKQARSPHKDSWFDRATIGTWQIQMSPLSTSWDLRITSR